MLHSHTLRLIFSSVWYGCHKKRVWEQLQQRIEWKIGESIGIFRGWWRYFQKTPTYFYTTSNHRLVFRSFTCDSCLMSFSPTLLYLWHKVGLVKKNFFFLFFLSFSCFYFCTNLLDRPDASLLLLGPLIWRYM